MTQLRVVHGGLADVAPDPALVADPEPDRALLERVVAGDQAAHRLLFERFYKRVLSFVRRRVADGGLAEEITADVFFEVWRNATAYRGESSVSTWVFGIANLKILSAQRHQSQPRRASVKVATDEVMARFADPNDQGESLMARHELARLLRAVERLPAGQRDVLRLAFVEGRSYPEIASALAISEANVKTRINRARSRLRNFIRFFREA